MDDLVHRFQNALQTLRRSYESELMQSMNAQITGPQMFVLLYIRQRQSCNLSKIAEKMEVKPSAITVMIDRLERSGYARRIPDKADRRSILVEVTPSGEQVLDKTFEERNRILGNYLSRLNPEEIRMITELMEKITDASGSAASK